MVCSLHRLERNIFVQITDCICQNCTIYLSNSHLREIKIKEVERYGLRLASATSPGAKPGDFPSLYCGS